MPKYLVVYSLMLHAQTFAYELKLAEDAGRDVTRVKICHNFPAEVYREGMQQCPSVLLPLPFPHAVVGKVEGEPERCSIYIQRPRFMLHHDAHCGIVLG